MSKWMAHPLTEPPAAPNSEDIDKSLNLAADIQHKIHYIDQRKPSKIGAQNVVVFVGHVDMSH